MKFIRSALAAAVISVASSGAMASSIPNATINVYDGMTTYKGLFTGNLADPTGNPISYELNVTDVNGATVTVSYLDTIEDSAPGSITYELFSDMTSGTGLVSEGLSLMTALTFDDVLGGSFTKMLGMGEYVLKLTHAGEGTHSSQSSISAVPLPAAAWLFGSAAMGLLGFARRRKQADVAAV
jgi:hypothetical protein